MKPNLPNIKRFIDLLSNAAKEHPNPVCHIKSIKSTCGSPGCVVGWAWYLMPDVFSNKEYSFCCCCKQLSNYFGIEATNSYTDDFYFFVNDWKLANDLDCPDAYCLVFALPQAYGNIMHDNAIALSTVIKYWTNYYNLLLSRVPSVLS